ncbi:MAG TPA: histidine triad nucleotide-binding protein [Elusimicrobiota bacterium]|nr:histidine triad nucleotide-binding protein [Elusimicrobiota bacterium]
MGGDCVFCRIVHGQLQAKIVHEDDLCLAFEDLNPAAPTHLLVVPKKHIPCLEKAGKEDAALLGHLQLVIGEAARKAGVDDAFRVVNNNGRGAGQSVDHLHYHVLAGRRMAWPPG